MLKLMSASLTRNGIFTQSQQKMLINCKEKKERLFSGEIWLLPLKQITKINIISKVTN